MFICPILLGIVLLIIVYQDFNYRTLSAYIVLIALALSAFYSVWMNGWKQTFTFVGINLLFIVFQMIGVFIYFSLKNKSYINIVNKYIGVGDILFFVVVSFSFSPVNFILFNLAAYILILLVFGILNVAFRYSKTVPLAGCLSVLLAIIVALHKIIHFEPYDDNMLLSFLN
jgi:hypothetical protein